MLKIRPYKLGSAGAALIAAACSEILGGTVFRTKRPAALRRHVVINWGTNAPVVARNVFNNPANVIYSMNKLQFFDKLSEKFGQFLPVYTTSFDVAKQWAEDKNVVYCRRTATGMAGQGITVAKTPDEVIKIPDGGFYSKRFKNSCEFRVHVAFGKVIQVIQKKKREGAEDDGFVRSNNNWVFARNLSVPCPDDLQAKAVEILAEMGLDFGAFDVAYSRRSGNYVFLEVNSAPGMDETSAKVYATAFVNQYRKVINGNI